MHLSYRNRIRLKKVLYVLAAAVTCLILFYVGTVTYMGRYIVYDRTGAHVNTDWQESMSSEVSYTESDITPSVTELPVTADAPSGSVRQLSGIYITLSMLKDVPAVRSAISAGGYRTIYIQLKDGYGNFYYNSNLGTANMAASVDTAAVSRLISDLVNDGCYIIAGIPSMADQRYCLNNVYLGLPLRSGALWVDDNYCYYMDPGNSGTREYLEIICRELANMGIKEVCLQDFRFPDTDDIVYSANKGETLTETARYLQDTLDGIVTMSFELAAGTGFNYELSSGRLYFTSPDATTMSNIVAEYAALVLSPELQLVFRNESRDTRFESYGHLSPLIEQ